ncbi:MBL fold metallo-hydrolase, partial [Thiolapillus sp.]|uniref:MBL fold metallo-hydrolase n=2 Tax=Thiolapillus sp. TaxID=2017437 RepID=UPI003AF819F7
MLKFASLGSGSRGNATLIQAGDTCLLLDSGFSLRELQQRLARLELTPDDLDAVLVTHEHGDHIKGVGPLARKYRRCQPWRAKRRLVVPSSREAALFSRRALRQRENKVGLRTRR